MFELQAFCAVTGREQLTVKVDHDQNICVFNGSAETLCCCEFLFYSIFFYFSYALHIVVFSLFIFIFSNLVNMYCSKWDCQNNVFIPWLFFFFRAASKPKLKTSLTKHEEYLVKPNKSHFQVNMK